jgi:hypothetical protein
MKVTRGAAVVVLVVIALAGCSQRYGAEQDGRKAGEAVCDLRDATTQSERDEATSDLKEQFDDLAGKYSMFTAEDRNDIDENLADLAEHRAQGNEELIQQDLKVIRRSVSHIDEDVDEIARAAWEGFFEGLSGCQ